MNDTVIVAIFTVIDDVMTTLGHRTHLLARTSDSEVPDRRARSPPVSFNNHQSAPSGCLRGMGYLSGKLSVSRFNRRLHALAHWFTWLLDLLCDLFAFRADRLHPRLTARAGVQVGARPPQQESARSCVLRLLCREGGVFLWLAVASVCAATRACRSASSCCLQACMI